MKALQAAANRAIAEWITAKKGKKPAAEIKPLQRAAEEAKQAWRKAETEFATEQKGDMGSTRRKRW